MGTIIAATRAIISIGVIFLISSGKTRGRFVCHILRIYIYLIKSTPGVKRIGLL